MGPCQETFCEDNAMSNANTLQERIEAEFRGAQEKVKEYQAAATQEFVGRQRRLEQFAEVCDRLSDVWRPRLEALAQKFHDRVQVTPRITKSGRTAVFQFQSPLARIELTFTAMTDQDVRHLVLDYTLRILPILMEFENNRQLKLPLDDVDPAAVSQWIDDRIVDAVRAYLQVHQNSYYLKGHLVRDPIANVEFPKYAAGATLEWKGTTYYFIGEETRSEYAKQNKISL
jgi:YHS domain-containing protein